ncbi:MAG TPA: hypothetical protein VLS46_00775 [Gaiellaceae bacterium]|nr:hypothetical protein [Gaiellaceae bacterium]
MQSLRLAAGLRRWPAVRWAAALAVAVLSAGLLVISSGLASALVGAPTGAGVGADAGTLWPFAAVAAGSALIGLIAASYLRTPIGADATLCDLRWPALGLLALHVATDLRSAEPLLVGATRPVVALAAVALLLWALRERLASERRATDSDAEASGETCTTCRPLFPRTSARDRHGHPAEQAPSPSRSVSGKA